MEVCTLEEEFAPKGSGLPRSDPEETGKLHVSTIIRYVETKLGLATVADWNLNVAAEVGFLWEDVLSATFAARMAARLEEVEKDGIVGSPDGLNVYEGELVNEEYKCTWRSMLRAIEDNWYYMTQFKSYCYMLGVYTTIARVLYLFGDWRDNKGPQYRVYKIDFTETELKENWDMILNHSAFMKEKGIWRMKRS